GADQATDQAARHVAAADKGDVVHTQSPCKQSHTLRHLDDFAVLFRGVRQRRFWGGVMRICWYMVPARLRLAWPAIVLSRGDLGTLWISPNFWPFRSRTRPRTCICPRACRR